MARAAVHMVLAVLVGSVAVVTDLTKAARRQRLAQQIKVLAVVVADQQAAALAARAW